jgi:phosphatidylglycerol---prolipoprotein diacylglyceryl transferase
MMWALIPGLIGARLNFLMFNWKTVFAGKSGTDLLLAVVSLWDGGIVFYGSVIGGIVGVVLYCRRRGIDPIRMFDVLAASLLLGEAFGRIGCFLYGCCYGRACELPWAVRFPPDSLTFEKLLLNGTIAENAEATIPLHPTQLYSSFMGFVLAGIVAWYFHRHSYRGAAMTLAWVLYPISRFVLETFRDDEPKRLGTPFTTAQLVSCVLLGTGILAMVWFHRQHRATAAARQRGATGSG